MMLIGNATCRIYEWVTCLALHGAQYLNAQMGDEDAGKDAYRVILVVWQLRRVDLGSSPGWWAANVGCQSTRITL